MRRNTTQTAIAGEYYVLAELARRDAVASLTIHNTKGVDILVAPPNRRIAYKVEVKTARNRPGRARLWHATEPCFQWHMHKKHETQRDPNLIFAFVWLPDPPASPRFFLVPSRHVAQYVRWEHALWLKERNGKDSDWRIFRIPESKWPTYENKWTLLRIPE
jgi:hypothetical protein